jgi:hypothetical protein
VARAPGFAMKKKAIFSLFGPLPAPLAADLVMSEKSALSLEKSWGCWRDSAKERMEVRVAAVCSGMGFLACRGGRFRTLDFKYSRSVCRLK